MIKVRTTFFAFNNGVEIKHVNGTTMVNNASEILQKARDFVKKEYTQANQVSIIRDDNYFSTIGSRIVVARSDIDTNYVFVLMVNKL